MSWFLAAVAAAISLWVVSLSRILSSSSCVPSYPPFLHSGSGKKRNVLLVIAHPDDESICYAKRIIQFTFSSGPDSSIVGYTTNPMIQVFCTNDSFLAFRRSLYPHFMYVNWKYTDTLMLGNADGIGNIRKEEIYRACAVLKVPLQQVKVIDHPNFQDGFKKTWDPELLARFIEDEIKVWEIDSIITFDDFGVSGHPNHRAVHLGVCTFLSNNKEKNTEAWELVSQSIFRKYSGPVDVWLSIMASSFCPQRQIYLLLNNHPSKSYLAMAEHESQWVWYASYWKLSFIDTHYSSLYLEARMQKYVPEVVCSLLRLYLHEYTSENQLGVKTSVGWFSC